MRTARRFVFALLLALPALAPAGLRAQEPSSAPAQAQAGGTAADPSASLQTRSVEPGAGLPQRAAPPRTLRDYTHVFAAFAVAWILLFGYVVSLGRRWSAVERELAARG
jgi:CcmD family protein